ncbi:NAD(P)-dependent oxidoreductase, partial [Reichenbachiella sp.]
MEILITGSNGYLGSRLSFELAKQGHQVTAVCHSKPIKDSEWASQMKEILIGDIRDQNFVEQICSQKVDCIIHLIS